MVLRFLLALVLFFSATAAGLLGAEASSTATKPNQPPAGTKKYELKYKFQPEETVRWEVEHRAKVRSTVQGTTQTADTLSLSVKVWKIASVDEQGNATLVYSVERVDIRQQFAGRQEVRYNSQTDKTANEALASYRTMYIDGMKTWQGYLQGVSEIVSRNR